MRCINEPRIFLITDIPYLFAYSNDIRKVGCFLKSRDAVLTSHVIIEMIRDDGNISLPSRQIIEIKECIFAIIVFTEKPGDVFGAVQLAPACAAFSLTVKKIMDEYTYRYLDGKNILVLKKKV